MEIITQTNRTILFDQINPSDDKMDLLTLVGDVKGMESLDDDKIKEINKHLLVSSFDEFLDKFEPTIYCFFNAATERVMYTTEKPTAIPEDSIQTIPLDHHNDFLKMLLTMIQTKRSQGIENVDFKFDKILDMISPKKVMDDIKFMRKEIHYLYGEHEKLDEGDPQRLDIADKLNIKMEEASKTYNNVMAMIPLALEDTKQRLFAGRGSTDGPAEKFIAGKLTMGETGELKIVERPKVDTTALIEAEENASNGLIEVFKEDYQNINDDPTDYVSELVIRTYCPLPVTDSTEIDVVQEVANYNNYLQFYQDSKNDFIKVAKPLIEKILGVYTFFDQYKSKNKGMLPSLLVTNCKLDMTVKSSNLPRLQVFLNTVNNKNDFRNTIWFGIVGDLEFNLESNVKLTRERFKGNKKIVNPNANTMESLTMLLYGIVDYRIQTFFSFETSEDTSFMSLAVKGVDEYMDRTKLLMRQDYSEYAIPALPNMSIVPKNKSGVTLDSFLLATENGAEVSKEKKDLLKIWIEGVYIPASYVAAGITAAYQCPEFLRTRYKEINKAYPGVRLDIEADDNAMRIATTLSKEISGYTTNIKDSINNRSFGFVFSSDNYQLDGKDLKQITVYKARSMQSVDNEFESIYKTTTATYITRMLRAQTQDNKHDNVKKFFSPNPDSQKSKWLANSSSKNSIMLPHDDIACTIEEEYGICNIDISFGGNTKNLEVILNKHVS